MQRELRLTIAVVFAVTQHLVPGGELRELERVQLRGCLHDDRVADPVRVDLQLQLLQRPVRSVHHLRDAVVYTASPHGDLPGDELRGVGLVPGRQCVRWRHPIQDGDELQLLELSMRGIQHHGVGGVWGRRLLSLPELWQLVHGCQQ